MGLFRKLTSIGTGGVVDFRSDKERIALYGRQTRNEIRRQGRTNDQAAQLAAENELLRQQLEQARLHTELATSTLPTAPPKDRNMIGRDAPLEDRVRSTDPAVKGEAIAEWKQGRASA